MNDFIVWWVDDVDETTHSVGSQHIVDIKITEDGKYEFTVQASGDSKFTYISYAPSLEEAKARAREIMEYHGIYFYGMEDV